MASFICLMCSSPTNTCAVKCAYCIWGSMSSNGDVACGFGTKCFNKATCPYTHAGPPSERLRSECRHGYSCSKKTTCSYLHPVFDKSKCQCRWGTGCKTASCPYLH